MKYIFTVALIVFCIVTCYILFETANIYRSLGLSIGSMNNLCINYLEFICVFMVVLSCITAYFPKLPIAAIVQSIGITLISLMIIPIFTEISHFNPTVYWSDFIKFANFSQPLCVILVIAVWVIWIRRFFLGKLNNKMSSHNI